MVPKPQENNVVTTVGTSEDLVDQDVSCVKTCCRRSVQHEVFLLVPLPIYRRPSSLLALALRAVACRWTSCGTSLWSSSSCQRYEVGWSQWHRAVLRGSRAVLDIMSLGQLSGGWMRLPAGIHWNVTLCIHSSREFHDALEVPNPLTMVSLVE